MKSVLLSFFIALNIYAIEIGKVPKEVTISGENGGLVKDGGM